MLDIAACFDHYGWSYTTPEANLWQSSFYTENEEEFDLYVMVVEDWVHFAVTPLLPTIEAAAAPRLHRLLLKLNQQMRLVRFALDGDGDPTLIADAPVARLTHAVFAQIVEAIVAYVGLLASELRRLAADPSYHSPLVQE